MSTHVHFVVLSLLLAACGGSIPVADGGPGDGGSTDAGRADAGAPDADVPDAGEADAGVPDAGAADSGTTDAGTTDAGAPDAGRPDAGSPDGGPSCAGLPDVVTFDFTWAVSSSVLTMQVGGLRADTIMVGRIEVPPAAAMPLGQAGQVRFVEYIDGQAQRQMTVSPFPCDFRGFVVGAASRTDPTGASSPMAWSNDINTQIIFSVASPGTVVLQPGRTYYVNLRNVDWVTGNPSCQGGSCNGLFNFYAPR